MACHEGVASGDMGAVYKAYELFGTGKFTYQQALDSAAKVCGFSGARNITMKKDIYIDPAYLVTNIEWAFKVWREQPWGKNVPFGQFCEYVLPYRVGNEELVPWREKLYYQFMPIIEKHKNDSDIVKPTYAAHLVLDSLLRAPFYFTGEMGTNIRIGPQIADWRGGSCLDLCDMMVYICRALGIPCGIEELPMRGNNNAPHYWNFIEDQDGKTWYFSMFYWWHRLMEAEKYADVYGKVFRHRFSLNWDMMYSMQTDAHFVHPEFRLPYFNVFDGHTDTSYDHPFDYGGWAGLDLGEKKAIGKIVYTPRNRDNFVRKGDLYELLVCHGGEWKSAGTQTAQSDSLLFRNIPKHALLLLRDLSRGEAERLFEYKDGVQKYW